MQRLRRSFARSKKGSWPRQVAFVNCFGEIFKALTEGIRRGEILCGHVDEVQTTHTVGHVVAGVCAARKHRHGSYKILLRHQPFFRME